MSVLLNHLSEIEPAVVAELSSAERRLLPAGSSHGADLFEGFSFVIVENGFVVVRRRISGGRGIVICHAGSGALLTVPEWEETLDGLVEARVTLVSDETYDKLLADPTLATVLSDGLRSALRQKRESIANFGSVQPVDRVKRKLVQLAQEHGRVVPNGIRLDFPITHELLGEMIGCARETVSRAIERLERTEFVVRDGRSYRLLVGPETIVTL
jgi:hypothetical protein